MPGILGSMHTSAEEHLPIQKATYGRAIIIFCNNWIYLTRTAAGEPALCLEAVSFDATRAKRLSISHRSEEGRPLARPAALDVVARLSLKQSIQTS